MDGNFLKIVAKLNENDNSLVQLLMVGIKKYRQFVKFFE